MDHREKFKRIAKETLAIVERGNYRISSGIVTIAEIVTSSVSRTVLYRPDTAISVDPENAKRYETAFEVTNETTLHAVKRLLDEGADRVVALNFASAKRPGGGFLSGAMARSQRCGQ